MLPDILMFFAIIAGTVPAHPQVATPPAEHRRTVRSPRKRGTIEFSLSRPVAPLPKPRPAQSALPAAAPVVSAALAAPPTVPAVLVPALLRPVEETVPPDVWNVAKFGQLPSTWFQIWGFIG